MPHAPFTAVDVKETYSAWFTARTRVQALPMTVLDEAAVCISVSFQKVLGIVAAIKLYDTPPRLVLPAREQEACIYVIERCTTTAFDKGTLRDKTVAEAVALLVDFVYQEGKTRHAFS